MVGNSEGTQRSIASTRVTEMHKKSIDRIEVSGFKQFNVIPNNVVACDDQIMPAKLASQANPDVWWSKV